MVGELSPALSPRVRRLRGRAGKMAPPVRVLRASTRTTAHNTHDLAPREKAPPRRQDQLDEDQDPRHHIDPTPLFSHERPDETTNTTTNPTTTPRSSPDLASCAPFYSWVPTPRSSPFTAPPPSSSCGKLPEKGRALSPPSPRAARGPRKSFLAQVQGDSFPQNQAPTLHDL